MMLVPCSTTIQDTGNWTTVNKTVQMTGTMVAASLLILQINTWNNTTLWKNLTCTTVAMERIKLCK